MRGIVVFAALAAELVAAHPPMFQRRKSDIEGDPVSIISGFPPLGTGTSRTSSIPTSISPGILPPHFPPNQKREIFPTIPVSPPPGSYFPPDRRSDQEKDEHESIISDILAPPTLTMITTLTPIILHTILPPPPSGETWYIPPIYTDLPGDLHDKRSDQEEERLTPVLPLPTVTIGLDERSNQEKERDTLSDILSLTVGVGGGLI